MTRHIWVWFLRWFSSRSFPLRSGEKFSWWPFKMHKRLFHHQQVWEVKLKFCSLLFQNQSMFDLWWKNLICLVNSRKKPFGSIIPRLILMKLFVCLQKLSKKVILCYRKGHQWWSMMVRPSPDRAVNSWTTLFLKLAEPRFLTKAVSSLLKNLDTTLYRG